MKSTCSTDWKHYRFSQGSEVLVITGESTFKILEQYPELWSDVATLLSFHLQFSSWRDLHLLNESAYISIRGKLLELNMQPPALRNKETILSYILTSTKLSRSTVLRVLKDLNDGGYIEIHKGLLIKINHLPLRY